MIYEFLKNKGVMDSLPSIAKVIDVGSGDGKEGREFETKGFEVTYVEKKDGIDATTFEYPKNYFDIAIAKNSLPFMGEAQLFVMERIHDSLKKGGIFYGTVFGKKDPWAKEKKITPLDFDATYFVLQQIGFEILWSSEEMGIGKTMKGDLKDWHIFKFLVKKIG